MMKKIIHLSDLHIGYQDCGAKFRQIVSNLTFLKEPASDYIIVITGDIVDNATDETQNEEALRSINLLKESGYTVLVIPGNHDYGRGAWGDPKYVKVFSETYFGKVDQAYPKLDVIEEAVFIGLDSMAEELHWHDRIFSDGELGKNQLGNLKTILDDSEFENKKKIVYLHHHPFDFILSLQLKDRDELRNVIENKIDVLLFGHYHDDSNSAGRIFNGKWGIPRAYNAGSSTHKSGNTGYHRVMDLTKDPRSDYDAKLL
jgi:predicted MPP superfamily phosphohydrolase